MRLGSNHPITTPTSAIMVAPDWDGLSRKDGLYAALNNVILALLWGRKEPTMGASGAVVMSFFGALFASLTLFLRFQESGPKIALPFIGFAIVALAAMMVAKLPGTFIKPEGSGRVIMWSSIGEGAALFIVNETLINLGRPDLIIPAMVIIVGLHFVPIAYLAPFRPLYVLATIMVVAGLTGFFVPQPSGVAIAGFAAAGALMAASIAAILREWSAKRDFRHSL